MQHDFLNNKTSHLGKKRWGQIRPEKFWVFSLCVMVFLMGYNFHDVEGGFSDVARYYEIIEMFFSSNDSLLYVIGYSLAYGNDFIYYLALFLFNKTSLGMQFVTGLVSATYFFLLIKGFSKKIFKFNDTSFILLLGLFCFPNLIYVITISRISMAIVFFFTGVLFFTKDRKMLSLLFFVLAGLTHFASLMFVFVFFFSVLLYNIWLKRSQKFFNKLCLFLPLIMYVLGIILFNYLMNTDVLSFLGDTRYEDYVKESENAQYDNFSWLYHLQFIFSLILPYVLLNVSKRNSFERFLLLTFLSITMAFASADQNFFNRWLMILPLIYSLYFTDLYLDSFSNKSNTYIKLRSSIMISGSIISIMLFVMVVYGSRMYLF